MRTAVRWTSADLNGFQDDGKRREIINGELFVAAVPHYYHQVVSDSLVAALNLWIEPRGAGLAVSAPGVIFLPADDIAPDVVWVSVARLPQILSDGKLYAAPELVVEILSLGKRNILRDREAKRKLYSRYGVREYWNADWVMRSIEVFRRGEGQLTVHATLYSGDTLTSPPLPEFTLALNDLLAEIPEGATYADGDE